jgi:hypothetical protein
MRGDDLQGQASGPGVIDAVIHNDGGVDHGDS